MKRTLIVLIGLGLALGLYVGTVESQPTGWLSYIVQDPQGVVRFRALAQYGEPVMVGHGTAVPTAANSGAPPADGEIYVVSAAAAEPDFRAYSANSAAWYYLAQTNLAAGIEEATAVWFAANQVIFEGATANAFEAVITTADTTGDTTFTLPSDNATWDGAGTFLFSVLATNAPEVANSLWGGTSQIIFEGVTANANELSISIFDPGADREFGIPDGGEASYSALVTLLDNGVGDVGDADALWSGGTVNDLLVYEGATGADANELMLMAFDPGADRTLYLPDAQEAQASFVVSTVDGMDIGEATAVWLIANGIVAEGTTADAFEFTIGGFAGDPSEDRTIAFDDNAGIVSLWNVRREDFDWCLVENLEEDYTAAVVTDNSENIVRLNGSPLGLLHYRFEAPGGPGYAGTLEPCNDGVLDLDNFTDDVDNEGLEMTVGSDRNGIGYAFDEEMAQTFYCEASITIADVSETDSVYFGLILAEAYQDLGAVNAHNTYAIFHIIDAAGDLRIQTELNGGGTLDDNVGTNFIDAATHVYRVEITADDVDFYEDGVQLVQTNAVLDADATDQFHCGLGYLNAAGDGTPAPGIVVNHIEYGTERNTP